MTERRYEPPFDGKPCPMCPSVWRGLAACVHNFLGEYERSFGGGERVGRKFWQMDEARGRVVLAVAHTDVDERLMKLLITTEAVTARVQVEGSFARVGDAVKTLREAFDPVQALGDVHFTHRAHSHGN